MSAQHAVFGQPISHSRSPAIHQAFAQAEGIALQYRTIEAGLEAFPAALQAFFDEGGRGANVTLPLKEEKAFITSGTAWTRSARVVSMVIPMKVPRALVSLMGLRSPMR